MQDTLPDKVLSRETGIINLDSSEGKGTHWVCYSKNNKNIYYFDSFGLDPPLELQEYLKSRNEKDKIEPFPELE